MPDPAKRSARWSYAAAGVALASAAVVALLGFTRHDEPQVVASAAVACGGTPAALDGLWGPQTRRALIARNPEAAASAAWLADVIDARVEHWPAARRAVCEDRAGLACLRDRQAELATAAAARERSVDDLVAIARGLRDPATCAAAPPVDAADEPEDDALARGALAVARLRDDPDPRALLAYGDALTSQAQRLADAGRTAEALAAAHAALVVEERIYGRAHPALLRLLALLGGAQDAAGKHADALATFARARAIAAAQLPPDAVPRITALLGYARAVGRDDPAGALASLALVPVQVPPAVRAEVEAARAALRRRIATH